MNTSKEPLYYNVLAVWAEGEYGKLKKLKRSSPTWQVAYEKARAIGSVPPLEMEEEWEKLQELGLRLTLFEDDDYPPLLREIHTPPFGLYVRGELPQKNSNAIAIVGTRRATPEGKDIAKSFAKELSFCGFVIVSGLAFGIDAAAHTGALDEKGVCIAVLANGLDSVYPHTNKNLAEKILGSGGGIISEYPIGSPPFGYRFIERNRIISGFSKGTLVIEVPDNSGSLATARFALEQNRDVFVTPGPINHPNFFGSHSLIRQGAELVTTPEHILLHYGFTQKEKKALEENLLSPEETLILEALRNVSYALDVDKITDVTKLEPRVVSQTLSFLLIKDLIKESGNGYIMN